MLKHKIIWESVIIWGTESRKIIPKQSSGSEKQRNKDMLMRNVILEPAIIMVWE